MRRHPFDPIALVFGLTFAGAAIVVLAGGSLSDDGDFLLPACLLGLGVALLIQNASRNRAARPAVPAATRTANDERDLFGYGPLYDEALRDLDAVDGTATVRTASGIEWTGPPMPTPSPSSANAEDGDVAATGIADQGDTPPGSDAPTDRPGD